jgi:putative transport protein
MDAMLDWLIELSHTSPVGHAIGLVTIVCAAGMALGSLKYKGIGLGSSGVLFVGIFAAQLSEPVEPHILTFVKEFGLVLFVFTIGLSLGPGFFASLRAEGLRLNVLAAVLVLLAGVLAPLLGWLAGQDPAAVAGLFAGASTNTPALGAAQQSLATLPGISAERLALPALACAVAYPAAIVGSLGVVLALKVMFRIDPVKEAMEYAAERRKSIEPLLRRTLVVENPEFAGVSIEAACRRVDSALVISRIRRAGQSEVQTAHRHTRLEAGDAVLAVGTAAQLDRFEDLVGCSSDEDLLSAPGQITYWRIAVTNKRVLGKSLAELGLEGLYGVEVTRLARGDVEVTAVASLRLQYGDVLQVVGTEEQLAKAAEVLGNSLKALNETQFIPLFAGICLGVIVGSIPLAMPGLANPLRLGLAGGPLIVALLLGRIGHLGRLVWHMPTSTNHAFREFGISLFFAALGLAAGDQFFAAVFSPRGLSWLATGIVITLAPLLAIGIWSRAVEKMNFVTLSGLLAGGTTNPPALNFATNLCQSEAPTLAYATVYPLTTLLRILVAQVLALMLCS